MTCSTSTAFPKRSPLRALALTKERSGPCRAEELVRRLIGYDRFETEAEYLLLQSIYADLRLYANFFQPVLKLVSKEHVDKKLIKRYDQAATPFQRVLAANDIPFETKARLTNLYVQLNPVQLRTSIDEKVAKLWKISR